MKDITNQKFGRLLAIRPASRNTKGIVLWECLCDCGKKKIISGPHLRNGSTKSCGCLKAENLSQPSGQHHRQWNGHEEISRSFYSQIQRRAERAGLEFSVTIDFLWRLYIKQGRRCALSGQEITFPSRVRSELGRFNNHHGASLDRIDALKGYTEENVQWVCQRINYMKHVMDEQEFLGWIRKIYDFNFGK